MRRKAEALRSSCPSNSNAGGILVTLIGGYEIFILRKSVSEVLESIRSRGYSLRFSNFLCMDV